MDMIFWRKIMNHKNNTQNKSLTRLAGFALIAIAYWLMVRTGLQLVARSEGVASVWPVSGLALAVLLLSPKSQWLKLLAVIFVTNALGNWSSGNALLVSLGFALVNTLEPALGAWVLIYFCGSKITFGRTLETFALFGIAILGNGITALLGAAIPALAFGAPFWKTWLVWWTANGLGIILIAPLIVTWVDSQNFFQSTSMRRLVESILLILTLAAFSWLLFGSFTIAETPVFRNYMFFPLLIWLAFRYSPRGMASALVLMAAIAIWKTLQGYGIFAFQNQSVTEHLESLQMFLSVAVFSGLLLSAMITERKQADVEIRQLNASLEQRVEKRTAQLRETQDKLVRQEKLAVLGQLAGSVGHELRDPLGVISNAVYFLKLTQSDASDKVKEYFDIIEEHTRISEKIVANLLDFTRIKPAEREPVPVSQLVHQTLERFSAPESVQVTLQIPDDLPQAYADSQQVLQILGNLILNACQAMPAGGQLSVEVESLTTDQWLLVSVKDSGVGISPENMKKLFEPLFTTRPKGIGLGLAVGRKLAEANGGRIEVQSEAGVGSTFTLYLPIYRSQS
jgi:signal transduction histidine kinase